MEDERDLIGQVLVKLALQIGSLIDICEAQEKIIDNLTKRIEKLEGAAPKADRKVEVSESELNRYKDFYNRYKDWGDQYL